MSALIPHSRPDLGLGEAEAARRVVLSGQLAQGQEVEAFEQEMAAYTGRGFAVAVSSGTAALHLGLLALGLGEGQGVAMPSYVCAALLHAVWAAGARPVICDVEPATGNLDPLEVRARLGEGLKAVIVPHMFGRPAAMEAFQSLGLICIEDCAMSIGAYHRGAPVGCFGALSACSFYATKVLSAGEGGMVLTDCQDLALAVRGQRQYDGLPADRLRFNCKMTEMAAAVGRVQLSRLGDLVARRREIAGLYTAAFAGLPLDLPLESPENIYYRYVVRTSRPAGEIIARLEERGVAARRPVFSPLHRELGLPDADYPHATAAWERDVSLPLYPALRQDEIQRIIEAVHAVTTSH